uniref:Uncharacterized protein n=1 Tax=Myoviridae sp. ctj3P51 TaxID=2826687 RepID=A0A8S5NQE5_9CAUD|nr:MAG TPA: hypothetical protein [Myoviridae sp. ctj3P51]
MHTYVSGPPQLVPSLTARPDCRLKLLVLKMAFGQLRIFLFLLRGPGLYGKLRLLRPRLVY